MYVTHRPGSWAVLAVLACVAGCRTESTPPSGTQNNLTYTSAHFVFHYTDLDTPTIASTATALEAEFDRIVSDLGAASMPRVSVTFYRDHASLQAAVRPAAGTIPSWASGLVTAADQIHMISLGVPSAGPYSRRVTDLVHEFAHAVSLRLNPSFANRPRWLWESVAIFEARQFVDPRSVSYMTALQPPPFSELNSFDNTRIYEVGYVIAEFIVSRGGAAALRSLIASNGDTTAVLGLSTPDMERDWFAFARTRYGF